MTTYDNFVCHTDEWIIFIIVLNPHLLIRVDTGAGRIVLGSNASVRATSVDKQVVCIRQSIGSHNCFSGLNLQVVGSSGLPTLTAAMKK